MKHPALSFSRLSQLFGSFLVLYTSSVKDTMGILIEISLTLCIALADMGVLTILGLHL